MALHPDFPTDPHVVLDPHIRWYPGDAALAEHGCLTLLPPLVYKIRLGVKTWRDAGYPGASSTTRALLNHWFKREHLLPNPDGSMRRFSYYFAQREAVESAIWLYEIERARDPYALLKYDSSKRVSMGMFEEDWTRYVMKLATGAGKTKVMSLLIAWAYFHRWYEPDSPLSSNFLLIAPNIIVLDRLRVDFDGLRIFSEDPVLPENGYEGQHWQDDFQVTLHVQDEIGVVSDTGNIFLTNIHRVFEQDHEPSFADDDTTDYFLGRRPTGKTNDSRDDLGTIIRDVPDLIVINDEAHHIHDPSMAWFRNIKDISNQLRLKGSSLAAQFDLSATPKHNNGAIFVQTISDYPLVEAIRQDVVKTPVLPDAASRARLRERATDRYAERYEDYLDLGYLEWQQATEKLASTGKKPVLFIMTDDTKNCDEVARHLESRYQDLSGAVLVIHTKNNGDISEASSGKSKEELDRLRALSREIDDPTNPYKAIVSVMVLREGWDVQNVVTIVGLRPFKAKSQILPEQALGRGLRRMFRGEDVEERVSVIGTEAFINFVEQIKVEGVELEYARMGPKSPPKSPMVIEVDKANPDKDIAALDIELPVLAPRIYREYKDLADLDITALPHRKLSYRHFTPEQQREIVFRNIDTEEISHTTQLDSAFEPNYQSMIGFFANGLLRDLRLVGGFDVLFGKLKQFIANELFETPVDLEDLNTLRNLSELDVTRTLLETFKTGINALTVRDRGTSELRDTIKLSKTRPSIVSPQAYVTATKSMFNKIVADSIFELEIAKFLDRCDDVVSFVKNSQSTRFRIEYRTGDGSIANYYPDFIVKQDAADIWIIETKGREDLEDPLKWERLQQWCADASTASAVAFRSLFLRQEDWERYPPPTTFAELCRTYAQKLRPTTIINQ